MGLFSFGRKKLEDGFEFVIDGIYALKGNSAVATGKLTRGRLIPGTEAICLNELGEPVFKCRISGIEQGTQILRAASYDTKGTYGAHYGFKLDGVTKEQIPAEGAVLVSVTEELEEALKEAAPVSAAESGSSFEHTGNTVVVRDSKAQEALLSAARRQEKSARPAGPLGAEREEQLSALLGEKLSDAVLVPLSIQECIFLLCRLQQMNHQAPVDGYEDKTQLLYNTVLEKLKAAPSLFILLDEGSSLPLVIGDTADVYSTKELALRALHFYEEQYHRHLVLREIPREKTGLPGRLSLFAWLYYLGMEKLLIDNGSYQLFVNRSDILESPEEETGQPLEVPVINPGLRYAAAEYLQEIRWHVSYSEREANVEGKKEQLKKELLQAKLLVPVKFEQTQGLEKGQNTIREENQDNLYFPRIENNEHKLFLPVFTDWLEFQKAYKREEWGCIIFSLPESLRAAAGDSIVINPLTENLIIDRGLVKEIAEMYRSSSKNA